MKLWIDDKRPAPPGWEWAKTSNEAISLLSGAPYTEISFDHDLGGDDTTRDVVMWLCHNDGHWPQKSYVHTMNSVGREWLLGMLRRYGTGAEYKEYVA